MAETKDDIAAERDKLREENEQLRRQLAASGAAPASGRVVAPQQTFMLSEGERQELAARGVLSIGGRLYSRDEVRQKLGDSQQDLDLGDAEPDQATMLALQQQRKAGAVEGVDYVYPSVAPGEIDPAVAGTPGISGPPAGDKTASAGTSAPAE